MLYANSGPLLDADLLHNEWFGAARSTVPKSSIWNSLRPGGRPDIAAGVPNLEGSWANLVRIDPPICQNRPYVQSVPIMTPAKTRPPAVG
jgi:hypothetical protein